MHTLAFAQWPPPPHSNARPHPIQTVITHPTRVVVHLRGPWKHGQVVPPVLMRDVEGRLSGVWVAGAELFPPLNVTRGYPYSNGSAVRVGQGNELDVLPPLHCWHSPVSNRVIVLNSVTEIRPGVPQMSVHEVFDLRTGLELKVFVESQPATGRSFLAERGT